MTSNSYQKSKHDGKPMKQGIQILPPAWDLPYEAWAEVLIGFTAWARTEAIHQRRDWQALFDSPDFTEYSEFDGRTDIEVRSYHVNRAVFRDSDEWQILDASTRELFPHCLKCRANNALVTDHIVPVWHRPDWRADPANLQTLCWNCNSAKGRWAFDFRPH